MTKRAILYARVSGDDRKRATSSIDGQLKDCRNYAGAQGYQIVGEYNEDADRHTSGADWLPELDKIVRLADQGFYDVLVVREVDRLARNRFKQMSIENQLESAGVRVEYAIGRYENTAEGRLLKGLMGEFAEFEREKIKQRMRRGVVRSIKDGNVMVGGSRAPYGYDSAIVNGRKQLIINEYEAAIILTIFDLYGRKGWSLHAVLDYLNDRKIPKPGKGKNHDRPALKSKPRGWSVGTLNIILNSETYVGRWYYHKTRATKDPKTGKVKQLPRPKEEWLMVKVPAIIEEDLFLLVQRRREQNKRVMGKNHRHQYLLGGLMDCGLCGNAVSGMTKVYSDAKKTGWYKCNAHHLPKRYGFKCDNLQFKVDEIDAVVWGWIRSIMLSPEKLAESLALYQGKQQDKYQPLLSMIAANEAKLETLQGEKDRLIKAYSQGILSLDELAPQKAALDKEMADLTRALADCRAELDPKLLGASDIASIQEWAREVGSGAAVIAEQDPKALRELFKLLQVQVTLGHEKEEGYRWVKISCVLGEKLLANDLQYDRLRWFCIDTKRVHP
jgi:site-specific DNA recombinase